MHIFVHLQVTNNLYSIYKMYRCGRVDAYFTNNTVKLTDLQVLGMQTSFMRCLPQLNYFVEIFSQQLLGL